MIDSLEPVLAAVPGLAERVDGRRIAVAGHSWGATSASALLGARVLEGEERVAGESMADPRVRGGLLLALAGTGGADLAPVAAESFAFMDPDFSAMTLPALLVAGDHDQSLLSVRGPDWWGSGFRLSPGPKSLVTLFGAAEHSLGGITGYASTETPDESPARVALLQRLTTAYLLDALDLDPAAWNEVSMSLDRGSQPLGTLESH